MLLGWSFFRRTSSQKRFNIVTYHPEDSLTWLFGVSVSVGPLLWTKPRLNSIGIGAGPFAVMGHGLTRGHGMAGFTAFWWTIDAHWQRRMPVKRWMAAMDARTRQDHCPNPTRGTEVEV